jgi:hypothetical protein
MTGRSGLGWLVPLAGVGFVVLGIVSFIVQGESKSADEPVKEIVDFYLDNKDSIIVAQVIGAIAGLLLIAFGAYLAKVLRAADEGTGFCPPSPAGFRDRGHRVRDRRHDPDRPCGGRR